MLLFFPNLVGFGIDGVGIFVPIPEIIGLSEILPIVPKRGPRLIVLAENEKGF